MVDKDKIIEILMNEIQGRDDIINMQETQLELKEQHIDSLQWQLMELKQRSALLEERLEDYKKVLKQNVKRQEQSTFMQQLFGRYV